MVLSSVCGPSFTILCTTAMSYLVAHFAPNAPLCLTMPLTSLQCCVGLATSWKSPHNCDGCGSSFCHCIMPHASLRLYMKTMIASRAHKTRKSRRVWGTGTSDPFTTVSKLRHHSSGAGPVSPFTCVFSSMLSIVFSFPGASLVGSCSGGWFFGVSVRSVRLLVLV